jgi:hypothetical protein
VKRPRENKEKYRGGSAGEFDPFNSSSKITTGMVVSAPKTRLEVARPIYVSLTPTSIVAAGQNVAAPWFCGLCRMLILCASSHRLSMNSGMQGQPGQGEMGPRHHADGRGGGG